MSRVSANKFRKVALSLSDVIEGAHQGHADFRVGKRVFATLGYPDENWGMVKLTPEQQGLFVRTEPAVFEPVKGAWGQKGCTYVRLEGATEPSVRQALLAAWRNTAPKKLVKQFEEG